MPIKFLGVGEGVDAIEAYNPGRLASRILGMGDVIGLIEKAEAASIRDQAEEQAERMLRGEFTLEDFARQLKQMRKMVPMGQLMEMLPGQMGQVARQVDPQDAESQINQIEAVINSMTIKSAEIQIIECQPPSQNCAGFRSGCASVQSGHEALPAKPKSC